MIEKIQFHFIAYQKNIKNNYYETEINKLGGKIFNIKNLSLINLFSFSSSIYKIIRQNNYDAIHCHTKYNSGIPLMIAWLCKIKIRVAHSHNTGGADKLSIFEKVYQKVMYFCINIFASRFTACSKKAAEHLFSDKNISHNYKYIPNSIEFDKFFEVDEIKLKKLRISLDINKNDKIIGHIGRFGKAKNHDFIIEIFDTLLKQDPDFTLILIGDGNGKIKIQNKIKDLNISNKVKVLGLRTDVPELINLMDVFILPSIYEGFGIVLLEAQSVGIPCIVSENIQKEVDVGLKLINWVHLQNKKSWISSIIKKKNDKIKNKSILENIISSSRFNISNVVKDFYCLYELDV